MQPLLTVVEAVARWQEWRQDRKPQDPELLLVFSEIQRVCGRLVLEVLTRADAAVRREAPDILRFTDPVIVGAMRTLIDDVVIAKGPPYLLRCPAPQDPERGALREILRGRKRDEAHVARWLRDQFRLK